MLKSLLNSSAYSVGAAAFSYALIIFLARSHSDAAFSHYLYVMAWGLLIVQAIDVASEQCLVHFARNNSRLITSAWQTIIVFKLTVLSFATAILLILSHLLNFDVPYEALLLIVPAAYMGPVYEYYDKNVFYAQLLLVEKVCLLISSVLITYFEFSIMLIIVSYFVISIASLMIQLCNFRDSIFQKSENIIFDIRLYTTSYLPVYLVLASQLVYGNISRIIIDAKIGAIAFASITLALQIVNAISMVQSQVDRHIRPLVIEAIRAHVRNDLWAIAKQYLLYYLIPIALGCVLMSIFAVDIISILFGPSWTEAGAALRYASPLVFTIACMRFIDILVVPLHAARMNLFVNVTSGALLFGLLWFNPSSSLESYVLLIVFCQAAHVAFMSTYVYARVKRAMAIVAATDNAPGISG